MAINLSKKIIKIGGVHLADKAKVINMKKLVFLLCTLLIYQFIIAQHRILKPLSYKHYIDEFNKDDNELYKEYIPNKESWKFLSENIPFLDCPDKNIEKTYYFRWWTFRKHIKKTLQGFVVTEFLPNVPWAGKYNTISCSASFHFYEGRWLKDQRYLNDYADFWFKGGGSLRAYSFWAANAIYNQYLVTSNPLIIKNLLPDMVTNFEQWEKEKFSSNGLFWQIDDRDGMEVSICGSGYRPTINSYMYGDALAISNIAKLSGDKGVAKTYADKSKALRLMMEKKLWDNSSDFFKVLPRDSSAQLCSTRELQGYTPWYFNIPDQQYSIAWKFLTDPKHFYAPYGPTTADQEDTKFKIAYTGHECQWNGPSWPYATSITLTALANLLNNYSQEHISKEDYLTLLQTYTKSQQLKREDGKIVPWIDENLNPFTGDWISRTRLKTWENGTWSSGKGGVERGKDYNHSTYCDLIISGLIGIRPQEGNVLVINPLIPDNAWAYFCLDRVSYHGKELTILYDKTGNRYKKGKGFFVFVDGVQKAYSKSIQKLEITL